jgi:ankyrin repeat protein
LIERNCDVNLIGGVLSSTPLHWAARHGHIKMVALLVRCGAEMGVRDGEGSIPKLFSFNNLTKSSKAEIKVSLRYT